MKVIVFVLLLSRLEFIENVKHGAEFDLILLSPEKSSDIPSTKDFGGGLWPFGIITYYLDTDSYDEIIAKRIYSAINTVESASCVQFRPVTIKPNNITWLHITNPQRKRECVHEGLSMDGHEIVLVLGYDCLKESNILHTLLHGIGLKDEVTHPMRDRFIRVLWNNILPEYRHLYRIQRQDSVKLLAEYDPTSIMHFQDRAFSSNGQATIIPLIPGLTIAPSERLSQLDTMALRLLFEHECNKRKVTNIIDSCKNVFYENNQDAEIISNEAASTEENNQEIENSEVPTEYSSEHDDNQSSDLNFNDKKSNEKLLSLDSYKMNKNTNESTSNDSGQKKHNVKLLSLNSYKMNKNSKESSSNHSGLQKNKVSLLSLNSFKSNKKNNGYKHFDQKNHKLKLLSLDSYKIKGKNNVELIHN